MESSARSVNQSASHAKVTPITDQYLEIFTAQKTPEVTHVVVASRKAPHWIRCIGLIWCALLILNGVWAFLMNRYVVDDKGNREAYFENSSRDFALYEALKIRILLLDYLDESEIPKLYTDDRGWYKRTNQHMDEDVDKSRLTKINGYTYLSITGYFLLIIWVIIGILDIFKFRKTKGLLNIVSFFLQGSALILEIVGYQMVYNQLKNFGDYYDDLMEKSKCTNLGDDLKKTAENYVIFDIPCLAIPGVHLLISLCYTVSLVGKRK